MSQKQEIYNELLRHCLLSSRATLSNLFVYGRARKQSYELCELTHNLYASILNEEIIDHDIWFLNYQARAYFENAKSSNLYEVIINLIRKLFLEVPENMRHKLEWKGP